MCRGTTVALAMLGVIGALKTFDVPYLVTKGGPNHATEFLGTYIYQIMVAGEALRLRGGDLRRPPGPRHRRRRRS